MHIKPYGCCLFHLNPSWSKCRCLLLCSIYRLQALRVTVVSGLRAFPFEDTSWLLCQEPCQIFACRDEGHHGFCCLGQPQLSQPMPSCRRLPGRTLGVSSSMSSCSTSRFLVSGLCPDNSSLRLADSSCRSCAQCNSEGLRNTRT